MLKLSNINVFYGRTQALWNVSLRIEEKEIVALVGANAAGKSTILNTISGLSHPTSGSVKFLGRRIDKVSPYQIVEAGISHIPEGRKLFHSMTVRENLELGSYTKKAWESKQETIEEVYRIFPRLKERERQFAKTLSGGEQQMVAIARGLMSRPRLCLFDEPSFGLSPIIVAEVFEVIKILREQGTTIFLVEQNVQRSLEIADRAYVLENGEIVLEGAGKVILHNKNIEAAFLGL
ncbi:MAG: ABC transporter ATP-binding protein [SAR202 cluster bacterium]|jgi:branched-chain amino acid transport system ATP-binding protein|nr:ABC transporter ATP-binding protein [SAR202 cluster bacterium]